MLFFLIFHGLVAVGLLGAVTHQTAALILRRHIRQPGFTGRYVSASSPVFTGAVIWFYVISTLLGAWLYPAYRLDVRIPLEEMQLGWAIGLFEMKEHFGGIGLGLLPVYAYLWRSKDDATVHIGRVGTTVLLAFIVWFDFLAGHVLNNIRGL